MTPDNNVDPKITDRSAKAFIKLIESDELYEELKKKDFEEKKENESGHSEKRKSK